MSDDAPVFMTLPKHADIVKMLSNSQYLTSDDLLGKDWTFEITHVGLVRIERNAVVKSEATKTAVRFKGVKKPYAFGITVYRTIVGIYGEPKGGAAWVGKLITIYPTTTKGKERGSIVGCVRVRPTKPTKATSEPMPETPVDLASAVDKAKAAGDLPPDFDPNDPDQGP